MFLLITLNYKIELLKNRNDVNVILITDVRYPAEMKFIKEYGGKIYSYCKNRTMTKIRHECKNKEKDMDKISNALSVTLLDDEKFDGYIKNDCNDDAMKECLKLF